MVDLDAVGAWLAQKTWKREVAVVMIAFVGWRWAIGDTSAAEFLTTPVLLWAGAAFGFDAYAKQIQR